MSVTQVVVTPVFEDRAAASELFRKLRPVLGPGSFIVVVDDGSVHEPVDPSSIRSAGLDGVVIRLRRNVGHQRAIAVGLHYVSENLPDATCIVMDSDGEDRPDAIEQLTRLLAPEDVDVVVAQRKKRVETSKFKLFYLVYKSLFRIMTGRRIDFGNFMALKPRATRRLVSMQELGIHLAACLLLSKLRISTCPLDRGPRYSGQSKLGFSGLALHGFRAFMVFAEDVLVRVGIACAAVALLTFLGIVISILLKFFGMATPGWFSVALGILVLVLLQTGTLTLMSLMLTGIVRGGVAQAVNYRDLIDEVLRTDGPVRLERKAAR